MKRLATASALLLASSGLVLAAAAPASAGISVPDLSLTHSPEPMTVGEVGTVTMTLTNNGSTTDDLNYTLTDNLPSQFTIGEVTDAGDFGECEVNNTSHFVSCSAFISLEAGATESVTFQVTPTESGDFENDALFTYFVSNTSERTKAHRSGLKPAGGSPVGGTAHDAIHVNAASTPTPTPTPTPTHTPTHKPTHKPTHTPAPKPSPTVKATHAALPNTGSSDLGILALVGMGLIVAGGVISAAVRSRRG